MAIGVVSDAEFESELSKVEITGEIVDLPRAGRNNQKEVPEVIREIIGEASLIDGRAEALTIAKTLGISNSSVSAYANGATSTATYREGNKKLKSALEVAKKRIAKSAREKLELALDQLSEEKLSEAKVRDISGVARDMSAIINDMSGKTDNNGEKSGPQFVIYAPQFKQENSFPVIELNE